jgi:hypothetical protein
MVLAEDDDVIQTLSTNRADHAFGVWILPRRSWRGWNLLNPDCPCLSVKRCPIDRISISDQVSRRLIGSAGLKQLTSRPDSRRMSLMTSGSILGRPGRRLFQRQ